MELFRKRIRKYHLIFFQDVESTDYGGMLTSGSVENKSVTIDESIRLVCVFLF